MVVEKEVDGGARNVHRWSERTNKRSMKWKKGNQ